MATVNLEMTASLEAMKTIGDLIKESQAAEGGDGLERAQRTRPESFENRNGYDSNFLSPWTISLPKATGNKSSEMLQLRDGSGVELKYRNFSIIMSKPRRMP